MTEMSLKDKVRAAGVVGAGGAGFPTHVKIDCKVDTVIVNGAECEPLLRVDQILMAKETDRLLKALNAVMESVGAKRGVIGIKEKHKEVIRILREASASYPNIEVFLLRDVYPAGDEHVLVYEVTGRVVPEGGIPLMVNTVVTNVETLLNIENAMRDIPVTETTLTVTGAVKKPVTLTLPLGVSFRDAIELAGGPTVEDFAVIDGGPMMGKVVLSIDIPVTKLTKGIIVLPKRHRLIRNKTQDIGTAVKKAFSVCCQCSLCTDLCPRNLLGHAIEPHRMMRAVAHNTTNDTSAFTTALLCSEWSVCDMFACPMDLSPRFINSQIKAEFARKGFKNPHKRSDLTPSRFREYRLVPTKRLIARIGVSEYDVKADLVNPGIAPKRVELLLKQHVGVPAVPVVKEGDSVKVGSLVADIPENALGARVHSSIEGKVVKVTDKSIIVEA